MVKGKQIGGAKAINELERIRNRNKIVSKNATIISEHSTYGGFKLVKNFPMNTLKTILHFNEPIIEQSAPPMVLNVNSPTFFIENKSAVEHQSSFQIPRRQSMQHN